MKDYKNLKVWQKAHKLTLEIYRVTRNFPEEEKFGIIFQIRKSSSAVSTNIAEGCGHHSQKEFSRYLNIAAGSASETEYLLLLSYDLGYLQDEDFNYCTRETGEVKKMLRSLIIKS